MIKCKKKFNLFNLFKNLKTFNLEKQIKKLM